MFRLQVKTHFDAAHRLSDYEGKCNREHGHRWDVEVCLEGRSLDHRNMLVDFGDVKSALKELLDECLDHYQLNESLLEPNPTAEFLAEWLFKNFSVYVKDWTTVRLVRTCIWESPDCCVKFSPDMRSVSNIFPITDGPNSAI